MPEGTLRGTLAQPIFEMLGAPRHSRRVEELVARYKAGRFAETLESNQPAKAAGQLRVFSNLIADRAAFDDARERTLTEYLTRSKGFHFNGPFLAISRLIETRTASEQPSLAVDLQLTDYYTFKVLQTLSSAHHLAPYGFRTYAGRTLSDYLAGDFQANIHASFGLAITVRTLADDR